MPIIRRNTSDSSPAGTKSATVGSSLNLRPRVLHSSMSPFGSYTNHNTQDLEFPSFPRSIGVIVRAEKRSPRAPETILVEQEWPTLTSVVRGEESDGENVEQLTRKKIQELSARCHAIAQELLKHASRLEDRLKDAQMVSIDASRGQALDNPQDRRVCHHNQRWGEHDVAPATRRPTQDNAPETPRRGKLAHISTHDRRSSKRDIDVAKLNRALSSEDDEDDD